MAQIRVRLNEALLKSIIKGEESDLITNAADDIVDAAKDLCPVRTGWLRSRIRVAGANHNEVLAEAYYASYVELGTRFSAPQPFLRPALDIVAARRGVKH